LLVTLIAAILGNAEKLPNVDEVCPLIDVDATH
jgi:hypothetical protein